MGNEFKGLAGHSAENFGDTRDYFWHDDHVSMVARRWRLERVRTVLDVGCGVGHWGRVLERVLPADARLTGIDREKLWVEKATRRAALAGLSERFEYLVGSAESLPFEAGVFDLVTCQTVLMHVRDPARVMAEMVRVTRPGGLVIAAEANNIAGGLVDSIALSDSPETAAALLYFQLVCERGKKAVGEGDNLIGESLPRLFVDSGLEAIEVRQNDRGWPMLPPYASPFEQAQVEEALDAVERRIWIWDLATTRRYFVAGGGDEREFPDRWQAAMAQRGRLAGAIRAGTHSCSGGGLFYLVWGWRPLSDAGS